MPVKNGPLVVDSGISAVVVVLGSTKPVTVVVAVDVVVEPPGTGVTGTVTGAGVVGAGVAEIRSTVVKPTPTRSREPVPDEVTSKRITILVLGDMSVAVASTLTEVNCVALLPMVVSGGPRFVKNAPFQ